MSPFQQASMLCAVLATCALTSSVEAWAFSGIQRQLLDTSTDTSMGVTTTTSANRPCEVPDAVADTEGNGCVFLSECTTCGENKCVAVLETNTLDSAVETSMTPAMNQTAVCLLISAMASGHGMDPAMLGGRKLLAAETGCPDAATLDTALASAEWAAINAGTSEMGITVDSLDAAKSYVADNCAAGPAGSAMGGCIGKDLVAFAEAQASQCANIEEQVDEVCHANPMLKNEACFKAMGAAVGIGADTINTVMTTAAELHTQCQTKTTAEECLAFDGSSLLKALNETKVELSGATQHYGLVTASTFATALLALLLA